MSRSLWIKKLNPCCVELLDQSQIFPDLPGPSQIPNAPGRAVAAAPVPRVRPAGLCTGGLLSQEALLSPTCAAVRILPISVNMCGDCIGNCQFPAKLLAVGGRLRRSTMINQTSKSSKETILRLSVERLKAM